jgi:hypothetical protein
MLPLFNYFHHLLSSFVHSARRTSFLFAERPLDSLRSSRISPSPFTIFVYLPALNASFRTFHFPLLKFLRLREEFSVSFLILILSIGTLQFAFSCRSSLLHLYLSFFSLLSCFLRCWLGPASLHRFSILWSSHCFSLNLKTFWIAFDFLIFCFSHSFFDHFALSWTPSDFSCCSFCDIVMC